MFNKKKLFSWEIILFFVVNFAILINIFFIIALVSTLLMVSIEDIENVIEEIIVAFLTFSMIPSFIIIKYLSIPIVLKIIQKRSKKEKIKQFIKTIAGNYKLQIIVLSTAIILDFITIFINYKYPDLYFNSYNFWYFIFGGLTGSYLAMFLFLFIRRKFKIFKAENREV